MSVMSLALSLFACSFMLAHASSPAIDPHFTRKQIADGDGVICMIAGNQVQCWGRKLNSHLEFKVEVPLQIAASGPTMCLLDGETVQCQRDGKWFAAAPRLIHPKEIAVSRNTVCALDDEGMKCWGEDAEAAVIPNLKNPRLLSALIYNSDRDIEYQEIKPFFCVVDDDQIRCSLPINLQVRAKTDDLVLGSREVCAHSESGWNCSEDKTQKFVSRWGPDALLSNMGGSFCLYQQGSFQCSDWGDGSSRLRLPFDPILVVTTLDRGICAIATNADVHCASGELASNSPWNLPPEIKKISIGHGFLCTLSSLGVRCFGEDYSYAKKVPELERPSDLTISRQNTCALDLKGVKCWGGSFSYKTDFSIPQDQFGQIQALGLAYGTLYLLTEERNIFAVWLDDQQSTQQSDLSALPPGPIQDFSVSDSYGVCFLVSGKLFCLKNLVAVQMLEGYAPFTKLKQSDKRLCVLQANTNHTICLQDEIKGPVSSEYVFNSEWPNHLPKDKFFELSLVCQIIKYSSGEGSFRCLNLEKLLVVKNPLTTSFENEFCIYDSGRMTCSNDLDSKGFYQIRHVPAVYGPLRTSSPSLFGLENLTKSLRMIANRSTPARRQFLQDLSQYFETSNATNEDLALLLKMLGPAILSSDSRDYINHYIPSYQKEVRGLGVSRSSNPMVPLRVAAASLRALTGFLDQEAKNEVALSMRTIGYALAEPSPPNITNAIDSIRKFTNANYSAIKTSFLVDTLKLCAEWLTGYLAK